MLKLNHSDRESVAHKLQEFFSFVIRKVTEENEMKLISEIKEMKREFEGAPIMTFKDMVMFGTTKTVKSGTYFGQIQNNDPHGYGRIDYVAGDKYKRASFVGYFKNGRKDGIGTYIWNDGGEFHGLFVSGKRQGPGVDTFKSGDIYKGNWKDGKREGDFQWYNPRTKTWTKLRYEKGKKIAE